MITASLASSAGSMLAGQASRKFSLLWLLYRIMVAGTLTAFGLVITAFYTSEGTRCAPWSTVDLHTGTMSADCYNNLSGWPRWYAEAACTYLTPSDMAPSYKNVQPLPNRPLVLNTLLWLTGMVSAYDLLMLMVAVISVQAVRDSVQVGWSSVQDLINAADRASAVVEGKEAEAAVKRVVRRAAQLKLLMSTLPYPMRPGQQTEQRYRFKIETSLGQAPWWLHRLLLLPYHNIAVRLTMFVVLLILPVVALIIILNGIDPFNLNVNNKFGCSVRWDQNAAQRLIPGNSVPNATLSACDFLYACELRRFATTWISYSVYVVFGLGIVVRIAYFTSMWWGSGITAPLQKRPADRMLVLKYDFPVWRQYFDAFDDQSEILRSIVHAIGIVQGVNTTDVSARNRATQSKVTALQLREEVQGLLRSQEGSVVANPNAWSNKSHKRRSKILSNTSMLATRAGPVIVDDAELQDDGGPGSYSQLPAFEDVFAAGQVRLKAMLWLILRIWHAVSLPTDRMSDDDAAAANSDLRNTYDKYAELLDHWPCELWQDDASTSLGNLRMDGLLNGWRIMLRHYQRMVESHEMETLLADSWLHYLSNQTQIDFLDAMRWLAKRLEFATSMDAAKLRKILADQYGRQFDLAPVRTSLDIQTLAALCNANPSQAFVATPIIRRVSRLLFVQLYTESGVSPPLIVTGYGTDTDDLVLLQTTLVSSHPLVPDIRSHLCTIVDLEQLISGRGWDGVKGTTGLHLAWPQYINIPFQETPDATVWTRVLQRAVSLRGYNGFAVLSALIASRDLDEDVDVAQLRAATWRVLQDLLLSESDTNESAAAEQWLIEIVKLLLSILFSRQDLTAGDRFQLSSKYIKSGFNWEFRALVVKMYVNKAANLWFVVSDENLLHVVLSLKNTPLEPLIRDALMAGATARVNSTTAYGTIALVEACAMYLSRTHGVDDLKEVVNALLDAGAEPNTADEKGETAMSLALGESVNGAPQDFEEEKSYPVGRRKGVIPKLSERYPGLGTTNATQEKRHRLRALLTHNRRNSEVAGSNVMDSVTTLRSWREEVLHLVMNGDGKADGAGPDSDEI